jgi:hypothetical protein
MAPQAYWRIGDTVAPRQLATPLFVAGSLNTKTISVGVFYNFANNSIGTFPMLIIGGKGGVYPVATKSLSKSGGYIGIGTGYFVGNNALFLEVGSLWGQGPFKPTLSTGAFIPLQKIIFQKKKKC